MKAFCHPKIHRRGILQDMIQIALFACHQKAVNVADPSANLLSCAYLLFLLPCCRRAGHLQPSCNLSQLNRTQRWVRYQQRCSAGLSCAQPPAIDASE